MPWFRVYGDILTDRKINRICKKTGQTQALVIGVWICLLALASDSPRRGLLLLAEDMPYTIDDIEDETGLPPEVLGQLLDEFRRHSMISGTTTIQIINWSKRQYKSDNVTERVQRHREKRSIETLPERFNTVIDTDTDTETDTDINATTATIFVSPAKILCDASGLSTFPANQLEWIEVVRSLVEDYGQEHTTAAMKSACSRWVNTKNKNGRNYPKTNLNWINWAQEELARAPMGTDVGFDPLKLPQAEYDAWLISQHPELAEE